MKCLTHIILTSTKPKKRDESIAIEKQIENFDFECMLVVQCKILQILNIPLKAMQCKTIDLISVHKLLQTAAEDISQLRRSFDTVLNEASTIASTWGLPRQFLNKRAKKTKAYFDQISEKITLYQVLEPSFLSKASHLDLEVEARKFCNKFSDNVPSLFPSEMLSIKTSFREKIAQLKSAKEMASFLNIEDASLVTTYRHVCRAYMMI